MTLWEFSRCVAGWNRMQGGEKPDPISNDEFDAELNRAGYG